MAFKITACAECAWAVKADPASPFMECHRFPPTPLSPDVSVFPKIRRDTWACAEGKPVPKPRAKRKPKAKKETPND